jgi:tetratricopeptide (TPR) repeat protein
LFYYWFYHENVGKSREYFEKYLAVTDPKPSDDYDRISLGYAEKKYQDCLNAAQQKVTALGARADPRYFRLIAYCHNDLGDSLNAKSNLDHYFSKQKSDAFLPMDYEFRASVLAKFPGNEMEASNNFELAVKADTVYESRIDLMTRAAAFAKKSGNRTVEEKWLSMVYNTKKKPSKTDLFNWGMSAYQAGMYPKSDSIWGQYIAKYPDEIFGYLWQARTSYAADTTMKSGILVAPHERLAEMSRKLDSVKYKKIATDAYFLLASYSNEVKKDKPATISYLKKVLEIDPGNTNAANFVKQLEARQNQSQPSRTPAAGPANKPKTGATTKPAGTGSVKSPAPATGTTTVVKSLVGVNN